MANSMEKVKNFEISDVWGSFLLISIGDPAMMGQIGYGD